MLIEPTSIVTRIPRRWVHGLIAAIMPHAWKTNESPAAYREYIPRNCSLLATLRGALRQPAHIDTLIKHEHSALVAVQQPFRLIIFPGSHKGMERLDQLRAAYDSTSGEPPKWMGKIDDAEWWDVVGKLLLEEEGFTEIQPVTITIEPGCAVIFSTWLLHAGCEYRDGDDVPSYRLHYYFVERPFEGDSKTINMHEVTYTVTNKDGLVDPNLARKCV